MNKDKLHINTHIWTTHKFKVKSICINHDENTHAEAHVVTTFIFAFFKDA